jgi:hypothetical protein
VERNHTAPRHVVCHAIPSGGPVTMLQRNIRDIPSLCLIFQAMSF